MQESNRRPHAGFRYQHQVIKSMRLCTVFIIPPNMFDRLNEPCHISRKTYLPKTKCLWHGVNFVVSTVQYITVRGRRKNDKHENIIVGMVSTNIWLLCVTLLYVNRRTNSKDQNIFVDMVTGFKEKSQWAHSASTLLLIDRWNYCTQSAQYLYAHPQDRAVS